MEQLKHITESISLWWSELHYSRELKKYLLVIAFAVITISAFYIFKPSEDSSASIAPPLVVDTVATEVTVDVQGAVKHPGVYTIGFGSRIIDAIKAAGGLAKNSDPSDINQARIVQDGEQIYIYAKTATQSTKGKPATKTRPTGIVSINQASAKQFESLNGIGPVLASKIVSYRKEHGPFSTIDDLLNVPGIGPAKLAKMKSKLRV
jgi:competence protein ComEA